MIDPVVFDSAGSLGNDDVIRKGLIFRSGRYEDKDFEMTPEELTAAVEAFTEPVPIDLQHTPTILDHKLGWVTAIEARGDELHGTVALPRWLDDAIGTTERRVSATWDRATKTLQGLALVLNPRVEDAALMSAYAAFAAKRHDTPHGQAALQMLHDHTASSGAVCKQANAQMASAHESSAIQQAHDLAVQHGAKCASTAAGKNGPAYPMFGAGDPVATPAPKKEGKRMGNFEKFMNWLAADNAAAEAVTEGAAAAGTAAMSGAPATQAQAAPVADAEAARMAADLASMRAENQRLRTAAITREAVLFATEMIRDGRAMPSEQAAIIDAFTQASIDDGVIGAVSFADGRTTSRVEIVKRQYQDRQSVRALFAESVGDDVLMALHNRQATPKKGDEPPSADETTRLIGMTAFGQSVIATRNGATKN